MTKIFYESLVNILICHKLCSKRSIRSFLNKNQITVNQKQIHDSKISVDAQNDEICVNDIPLKKINHVYVMLNKPQMYVCAKKSDRHKVVNELFYDQDFYQKLKKEGLELNTVGRLDQDTTGLLLLTTNGAFSNFITRPENKIPKTYIVELENTVSKQQALKYIELAKKGLILPADKKAGEQQSKPCRIDFCNLENADSFNICYVTVTSGIFHEVKRIILALGNHVKNLKRVSIAGIVLDENLEPGQYKILDRDKLEKLLDKKFL